MAVLPDSASRRRLLVAAVVAGLLASAVQQTAIAGIASFAPAVRSGVLRAVEVGGVTAVVVVLVTLLSSALWFAPYLLVVLVTVADPSRETVAGGVAVLYVLGLLQILAFTLASPGGFTPAVLAVPLATVAPYLGVATAVWVAHHGGYEQLADALKDAPEHPLFAVVAEESLGSDLPLGRGLVAAGLGSFVVVGGLVVAGWLQELLTTPARSAFPGTSVRFTATSVGLELDAVPETWLFEATFLLAVLLVTGPRVGPRDVLKGVALVVGVRLTVAVVPAVVPPFESVALWESGGPMLGALASVVLVVGIAVGAWLAFRDGVERLPVGPA
jgi:hypothetical protein